MGWWPPWRCQYSIAGDCPDETYYDNELVLEQEEYHDSGMGLESERSSGVHFIEIHSRTAGLSFLTVFLILLGLMLLACCYRRFCSAHPLPTANQIPMIQLPAPVQAPPLVP